MNVRVVREWSGVAALVLVLLGGAAYAGEAVLELGRKNEAAATTTLTNAGSGPALRLSSSEGAPSLAVSSDEVVPNLNASLLEGHRAGDFAPAQGSPQYLPADGFQVLAYDYLQGPRPGQFYRRNLKMPGTGSLYVAATGNCRVNDANPVFIKVTAWTGSLLVPFGYGLDASTPTRIGCRVEKVASAVEGAVVPVKVQWGPGSANGDLESVTIMVIFSPNSLGPK